jgi:large subunit ribosomal protein L17
MNKKVFGRKLSRSRPAREALFATLVQAMVINGKIVTTKAKGKAVIGEIEHTVTLARKGGVSARRLVLGRLDNARKVTDKLFDSIAKAFEKRSSGFTRMTNLPRRKGDNAQMVRIEWTEKIGEPTVRAKKVVKKTVKKNAKKTEKKVVKKVKNENISTKKK